MPAPSWWGTGLIVGRCVSHNEKGEQKLAAQKTLCLELLAAGELTTRQLAAKLKRQASTLWRWRRKDPHFDDAFCKAIDRRDVIQLAHVEDSQYQRIIAGKASAAEVIFFLKNRGPDRWKDRQAIGISGDLSVNVDEVRRDLANRLARRAAAERDRATA